MDADDVRDGGAWVWPEDHPDLRTVAINEVVTIEESPLRLPAPLASQVRHAGERFGIYSFTIVLRDGRRLREAAVMPEFPPLPAGVLERDCASVVTGVPPGKLDGTAPPKPATGPCPWAWRLYRAAG